MRELIDAPDLLSKIFPEANRLEEKALLFLELKERCKSFREVSRALGANPETESLFHHQTVSRLYRFLKDTEVYAQYTWEKNEQVKDFLSKDFLGTIHDDYKEQRERIEKEIKDALATGDKKSALVWIREKRLLLKAMVSTAISLSPKQPFVPRMPQKNEDMPQPEEKEYAEALENYKRSTRLDA